MTRWLAYSALLGLAALACSHDCVLDDDVRLFAGDSATDCGTAGPTHERTDVDQCAVDAFDAGSPFIARYETMGADSKIVVAVASNSAGTIKIFRWDDQPCGGPSCPPVTDEQTCQGPSPNQDIGSDALDLPIACDSLEQPQRICE